MPTCPKCAGPELANHPTGIRYCPDDCGYQDGGELAHNMKHLEKIDGQLEWVGDNSKYFMPDKPTKWEKRVAVGVVIGVLVLVLWNVREVL